MMWHYTVGFLFVVLMSNVGQICDAKRSEVISITSENWKDTLEGEWVIKFYALWCSACKSIEADYKAFADWSDDLNIRVAEVNIDEEPGLSGRFIVTALPSIYHAKNGEFRRYTGERHSNALHKYVEEEFWRATEPVAWYRHPDSIPMSLMSSLFQSSILIKGFYESLTETYGFSTATAYIIFGLATVATGLVLGLILVFIIDCVSPSNARPPQHAMVQDADMEKESADEEEDDRESTGRESVSGSEQGDGDKRASRDASSEDEENEAQRSQGSSQSSSQTSQEWEKVQEVETEEAEKAFEAETQIPADEEEEQGEVRNEEEDQGEVRNEEEGQGEVRKRNVQKPEDDEKK